MKTAIAACKARASCLLVLLGILAPSGAGQATPSKHTDGTTHWYEVVPAPQGITWGQAHAAAAARGGYLATITSAQENQALFALADKPEAWSFDSASNRWNGPWLGGLKVPSRTLFTSSWTWAELEPMSYTSWAPGEPREAMELDRISFAAAARRGATWASAPEAALRLAYIVEYSGPMSLRTVGLLRRELTSFDGYTLFSPFSNAVAYLMDPQGRVVNQWTSQYPPGTGAKLLPNGNLLRGGQLLNSIFCCGAGGIVEEFDWDDKIVWSYMHSTSTGVQHHDVERLPSGNTLMIVWDLKRRDECLAAGRDPNLLRDGAVWSERIIEVDRAGRIVWEWKVWDHLVQDVDATKANYADVTKHPELVDLNFGLDVGQADWLHANAVSYNANLDQIMFSVRHFDELWVIDHSTTLAEAAGHTGGRSGKGGDLLYRWGNPLAYRAGSTADQRLFQQHDCHWIPDGLPGAGNILVFNNGGRRPGGNATTVDEIVPPKMDAQGNYERVGSAWGPSGPVWQYPAKPDPAFFCQFVGGVQRLPNGNTLIAEGWNGRTFEVTPQENVVWEYRVPIVGVGGLAAWQGDVLDGLDTGRFFRSPRYAADYPGLTSKNLAPREPVERYQAALLVDGSTVRRTVHLNTRVDFDLIASDGRGQLYVIGTGTTPGMLAIDYRFLRSGYDDLMVLSAGGSFPSIFKGYAGFLDGQGRGKASFALPAMPELVGLTFYTTFFVVDLAARSSIRTISNTVVVRVL